MGGDEQKKSDSAGPLASLEDAKKHVRATQIAELERRKANLLERRELIDREIGKLEAKLDALQE